MSVKPGKTSAETTPAAVTEVSETGGAHTVLPQEEQPQIDVVENINDSKLYALLLAAFALGIGVSYLLLRGFAGKTGEPKIRNYKKYIIAKAQEKDLRALRDALIEWAKKHYHNENITTLTDISEVAKVPEFDCELDKLTESLYSKIAWNGMTKAL